MPDNMLARRRYPREVITHDGAQTHDPRLRRTQMIGFAAGGLSAPEIDSGRDA